VNLNTRGVTRRAAGMVRGLPRRDGDGASGAGAFYGLSAFRPSSPGSLAMLAAMRRASSRVSKWAADPSRNAAKDDALPIDGGREMA
jgi:hypothetical protein